MAKKSNKFSITNIMNEYLTEERRIGNEVPAGITSERVQRIYDARIKEDGKIQDDEDKISLVQTIVAGLQHNESEVEIIHQGDRSINSARTFYNNNIEEGAYNNMMKGLFNAGLTSLTSIPKVGYGDDTNISITNKNKKETIRELGVGEELHIIVKWGDRDDGDPYSQYKEIKFMQISIMDNNTGKEDIIYRHEEGEEDYIKNEKHKKAPIGHGINNKGQEVGVWDNGRGGVLGRLSNGRFASLQGVL